MTHLGGKNSLLEYQPMRKVEMKSSFFSNSADVNKVLRTPIHKKPHGMLTKGKDILFVKVSVSKIDNLVCTKVV